MIRYFFALSVTATLSFVMISGTDNNSDSALSSTFFDMILDIAKKFLCKTKEGDPETDDIFQMIIDLAKIFLCETDSSGGK